MAYTYGILPSFGGVRMDLSPYLLPPDCSPDACNMDTRSGSLRSAKGFSRVLQGMLPANETPIRMYIYPTERGKRYLAVTLNKIWLYRSVTRVWESVYTFTANLRPELIDFLPVRIGSEDRLLIAHGKGQMLQFNEADSEITPFGSAEKLSDRRICCAELYFGRLFAAGDPLVPSRLYWSKAPGGTRAIDDWRADPASENVSGGFVDVGIDDDPITGLFALSNQLLIFKRDTLYRLLGDRPGNYRVLPVDAPFRQPLQTACVRYADRLYFLSEGGLCCYDGQTVRRPGAFRALEPLLKSADFGSAKAAACDDKLYFAIRSDSGQTYNDLVIEYDLLRDRYMLRRGFTAADLFGAHGLLYALTGTGKIVVFDDSDTYDGDPIHAWWQTPKFDLGHKETNKTLLALIADGTGSADVRVESNGGTYDARLTFPDTADSVGEIPLRGAGRIFRLRFSDADGAPLSIEAGVSLKYDVQRRPG